MKIIKVIIAFALFGVVIITSCKLPDSMGTVNVTRELTSTIFFDTLNPNQSFDSIYLINIKNLKSTVKEKTGSSDYLTDLNFTKVNLSIPDSINFTFADLQETKLLLGSNTLVILPTDASGKNLDFILPDWVSSVNYKDLYQLSAPIEIRYTGKAAKALDSAYIKATYTFRIKAVVKI